MRVAIDTDFLVRLSIMDHPGRAVATAMRDRHLDAGDRFALAPQVVLEFVHVVTDPRRFSAPLTVAEALRVARAWWEAAEVDPLLPEVAVMPRFFDLIAEHRLGRKRILDMSNLINSSYSDVYKRLLSPLLDEILPDLCQVRDCPKLSDRDWLACGICRVIDNVASG